MNLIGDFGAAESGPIPVAIRVVGALQGKAPGAREWRPIERLPRVRVDPLSGGPYIVDAWTLTPSLYRGDRNRCLAGKTFVRVMRSNGLTAYPSGEGVGAAVVASYRALYALPNGKSVAVGPLEVADLHDHESSFNADNMLSCRGTGTPTVVLISGFRGPYDDWIHIVAGPAKTPAPSRRAVFPQVGRFTRVCAYDRPGTVGFDGAISPSTPVRQPTTAADGVADLHALLGAAGEQAPYLLVAHSWGGMIAQLYLRTYPRQVAGVVLADPGSPYLKATLKPGQWRRFARNALKPGNPRTLEAADYEPSVRQIGFAAPVPEVPAVVLTSDHPFPFGAGGDTWPAWLGAQNLLAASLGAEHVTHTDSGHYIAGERPGMVVAAVRRVWSAVR